MNSVLSPNRSSRFVCHRATPSEVGRCGISQTQLWAPKNWSHLGILCKRLLTETWRISSPILGLSAPLALEFTNFRNAKLIRIFKNKMRLVISRFVNTWRGRPALIRNIEFSTRSIGTLSLLMIRNAFKLVMDFVLLDFMCFQLSVTTTSNVSHVESHAPVAKICVGLG